MSRTMSTLCLLVSLAAAPLTTALGDTQISKEVFDARIDEVVQLLRPTVNRHGAQIVSERYWQLDTTNASAWREGRNWFVQFDGGWARRSGVTPDVFSFTACHEFGHQLGGFPFLNPENPQAAYRMKWMTAEGQVDYYAALVCARQLWKEQTEINRAYADKVDPIAKRECDDVWDNTAARELCYRVTTVGREFILQIHAEYMPSDPIPSFANPEPAKQEQSDWMQSVSLQCRLDSILQGSLCKVDPNVNVIPGYLHPGGINSTGAKIEADSWACSKNAGQTKGIRPACWYNF